MPTNVSVLIDTHNHERYIGAAIESVLTQQKLGNAASEIIVIDDGSTDGTAEIVNSFGNKLRYHSKRNGGQASAFNFGIPLCRGDVICFLDGDDWWDPNKLRTVLDAFIANESTCAVGHSIIEVDEVSGKSFLVGPQSPTPINFASAESIATFHKFSCCLGTSRLAMRRSTALDLLTIPEELVFEADEYMFTLLPTLGDVIVLPEPLTYYRIHGDNLYQDSRSATLNFGDTRAIKRAAIYDCLSKRLPDELRKRGCEPSLIDLLLGPVQIQASRLKLSTRGGTPFENFRSERRASELAARHNGTFGSVVLLLSLAFALMLPPKWYFRIRQAYAKALRRWTTYS